MPFALSVAQLEINCLNRVMDRHPSGCLPVEKFPTFASGQQDRGPVALSGFHPQFPRAKPRDVPQEESPAYGDGSGRPVHSVRL
jgi:hypothetical protein